MPDLLFLEVNSSYSHSMLSYGVLRAFTERHAPEWKWHKLEQTVRNPDEAALIALLRELQPEVVCGTAYLFNIDALIHLVRIVRRELPKARIVLGGPEFLGDNREFLRRNPEVTAVLRGDESNFHHYLRHNEILDGCYDGELDDLPSPHQLGYVAHGKPFWQIETSRGCGGRCVFCTSAISSTVKYHSLERVRADLAALREAGFKDIRVLDRTFNRNQRRAAALLRMFREEFPEIRFHLEIEPCGLSAEFLHELSLAPHGMLHVEAGVQSLDPTVLTACRRRGEVVEVLRCLHGLLECGNFELHTDLISGLPGQTLAGVLRDAETLIRIGADEVQLETLKVLPGTALREAAPEFNPDPPYQVLSTSGMNGGEIRAAVRLSQILDGWYNAKQLQPVFLRAVREDANFLSHFLEHLRDRDDLFEHGKPALEIRYRILQEFPGLSLAVRDVLRFGSLFYGTDHTPRREKISALSLDPVRVIWHKEVGQPPERCILADFAGNAGECFLNPSVAWQATPTRYCFKLHYGRFPSEIIVMRG